MSRSTSRRTVAAVPGALFLGVAGRGDGAPSSSGGPGTTGRGDSSWAGPVDQHADFAEFTLAEGSAPPTGEPPASDDDSDCGIPSAS